jgi:hypothetical protein
VSRFVQRRRRKIHVTKSPVSFVGPPGLHDGDDVGEFFVAEEMALYPLVVEDAMKPGAVLFDGLGSPEERQHLLGIGLIEGGKGQDAVAQPRAVQFRVALGAAVPTGAGQVGQDPNVRVGPVVSVLGVSGVAGHAVPAAKLPHEREPPVVRDVDGQKRGCPRECVAAVPADPLASSGPFR